MGKKDEKITLPHAFAWGFRGMVFIVTQFEKFVSFVDEYLRYLVYANPLRRALRQARIASTISQAVKS